MLLSNPFSNATMDRQPGNQGGQSNQQPNNGNNGNQLQNNQNNNNGNDGSQTIPNNGNNNNNANDDDNANLGDDSLENFKGLWQDAPVDPKATPQDTSFLPKIDPKQLQETLSKLDYSKAISPEDLQAIQAGGDGAAAALPKILNSALRASMGTMYTAMNKMMESAFTNAEGRFLGKVPASVKDIMTQDSLTGSNKIMQDPTYAPLVEATRQRFTTKFPKATPKQIETAVNKYFDDMAKSLTKQADPNEQDLALDAATKRKQGAPDADFVSWFES